MCAIFGFYRNPNPNHVVGQDHQMTKVDLGKVLAKLSGLCSTRGRDGAGVTMFKSGLTGPRVEHIRGTDVSQVSHAMHKIEGNSLNALIGNCRAEPTTEWTPTPDASKLQPYAYFGLHAVHNGTIANDRLFLDQVRGMEGMIDSNAIPVAAAFGRFDELVGSQATALFNNCDHDMLIGTGLHLGPGDLMLHRNYRPLSVIYVPALGGWLFASKLDFLRRALPAYVSYILVDLPANSSMFLPSKRLVNHLPEGRDKEDHAIVILSGGLDSTTVAKIAVAKHPQTTLIHFLYGCRAQSKETEAVKLIASRLQEEYPAKQIKLEFIDMSFLKELGGSTLTDPDAKIAEGEAGAEYAHEWVPFRNGLMLSSIVAYCDRHRCSHIYLGANLEEAGAYGDNEEEFYELMNRAVAIGSKSAPTIVNPLDNLMKHEIVRLAADIEAPYDLSWSCYHGGTHHCGNCGPCFMRRRAFAMNGLTDPLTYADEV